MENQPLEAPAPVAPTPPKPSKKKLVLTIIGVILLVAAVGGGVYYWQHQQVTQLQAEVDSLNAKVTDLEKAAAKESTTTTDSVATSDEVTITLKELGISFSGPASLGDLTYSYSTRTIDNGKTVLVANLSSKSLTDFDANCSAEGKAPPLGLIAKVQGQYPANPTPENSIGPLIKQFPTFYIGGHLNAQSACSDKDYPADLEAKTTTLRNDLTQALKSVQQL